MHATSQCAAIHRMDVTVQAHSTFHNPETPAQAVQADCYHCACGNNNTFLHAILYPIALHPLLSVWHLPNAAYFCAVFLPVPHGYTYVLLPPLLPLLLHLR